MYPAASGAAFVTRHANAPQKSHEQAPHSEDPREIIGDAQDSGQEGIVLV
jgi:hypothetical protein